MNDVFFMFSSSKSCVVQCQCVHNYFCKKKITRALRLSHTTLLLFLLSVHVFLMSVPTDNEVIAKKNEADFSFITERQTAAVDLGTDPTSYSEVVLCTLYS